MSLTILGMKFDCCLLTCTICCKDNLYRKCKKEWSNDALSYKVVSFEDKTGLKSGNRQNVKNINGLHNCSIICLYNY